MTDALPTPIPAATLVIFREIAAGPPELLMVERAKGMVFAAGAMVFPGGRIDPADRLLARTLANQDSDHDDIAARIAAIRETIEEAGLPIGIDPVPDAGMLDHMRAMLHSGQTLATVLDAAGTRLSLESLVAFARWRPAHQHRRIFDTRFYLARLPMDAPQASVDQTENTRLVWATARSVLADADAGRLQIIYPTRRNLERLAQFHGFDDAVAQAASHPVRVVTPWIEQRDGRAHLCIPADLGYPVTSEPLDDAMRG